MEIMMVSKPVRNRFGNRLETGSKPVLNRFSNRFFGIILKFECLMKIQVFAKIFVFYSIAQFLLDQKFYSRPKVIISCPLVTLTLYFFSHTQEKKFFFFFFSYPQYYIVIDPQLSLNRTKLSHRSTFLTPSLWS